METEGYEWTKGAVRYLCQCGLWIVLIVFLLNVARLILGLGMDDSDASGFDRSGLKIHKDAKTGIEYLSDGRGGLIRRETK